MKIIFKILFLLQLGFTNPIWATAIQNNFFLSRTEVKTTLKSLNEAVDISSKINLSNNLAGILARHGDVKSNRLSTLFARLNDYTVSTNLSELNKADILSKNGVGVLYKFDNDKKFFIEYGDDGYPTGKAYDLQNSQVDVDKNTIGKIEVLHGAGNIFELSTFKNLTARIPTGSKLTNLKKAEFLTHGYKVKPTSGGLKTQIDDIIANGDNLGAKTEGIVDDIMSGNGYTKMDGKYGSNNGYDGVYIKGTASNPTEIVIIESKQFKYTNGVADDVLEHSGVTLNYPNQNTGLASQMSDTWIRQVAEKLSTNTNTKLMGDKIQELLLTDPSKIQKYLSAVDKTQGEINFLKLGNY